MALSMDLRHRVIAAFERGESAASIASRFEISQSTAFNLRVRHAAGRLEPDKSGPKGHTKLTEADLRTLETTVAQQPDITLAKLAAKMSVPVVESTLKKLGLTLKKSR
jgi:transposase